MWNNWNSYMPLVLKYTKANVSENHLALSGKVKH